LSFRIVCAGVHEHANVAHFLALLRACASGHAPAVPPKSVMNSRLFTRLRACLKTWRLL
jgi:hypothetical protein